MDENQNIPNQQSNEQSNINNQQLNENQVNNQSSGFQIQINQNNQQQNSQSSQLNNIQPSRTSQNMPSFNQFNFPSNPLGSTPNQIHPPMNQFGPPYPNQINPPMNQFGPPYPNQFNPPMNQFGPPYPNQFNPPMNQIDPPYPNLFNPPINQIGPPFPNQFNPPIDPLFPNQMNNQINNGFIPSVPNQLNPFNSSTQYMPSMNNPFGTSSNIMNSQINMFMPHSNQFNSNSNLSGGGNLYYAQPNQNIQNPFNSFNMSNTLYPGQFNYRTMYSQNNYFGVPPSYNMPPFLPNYNLPYRNLPPQNTQHQIRRNLFPINNIGPIDFLNDNIDDTKNKQKIIDSLIEIEFTENTNNKYDEEECSICLGDFCKGNKICCLNCSHIFHSKCIKDWIKKKNICPLCNKTIN